MLKCVTVLIILTFVLFTCMRLIHFRVTTRYPKFLQKIGYKNTKKNPKVYVGELLENSHFYMQIEENSLLSQKVWALGLPPSSCCYVPVLYTTSNADPVFSPDTVMAFNPFHYTPSRYCHRRDRGATILPQWRKTP